MWDRTTERARPGGTGVLARLARENSGSTAIIFAGVAAVLLVAVGAMIDYGRTSNLRGEMQAAADAAVLAAGRQAALQGNDLITTARSHFDQNLVSGAAQAITHFSATRADGVTTVRVRANVETTFLAVAGIETVEAEVISRAAFQSSPVEVALVLDNTGSMASHMASLRSGATDLVEMLYDRGGEQNVDVAVVPFNGAVNIGSNAPLSWLDTGGQAQYHAYWLRSRWVAFDPSCTPGGGGGGEDPGPGTGGGDRTAFLGGIIERLGESVAGFFAVPSARAGDPDNPPAGYDVSSDGCYLINSHTINLFDLFDAIPNATWKGCVEARPEPFDADDTPPSNSNPDTRWVPYFWPDESDRFETWVYPFPNDYLPEDESQVPAPFSFNGSQYFHTYWQGKYNGTAAVIDETGPETTGPNKACPDPILPLGSPKVQVLNKINGLSHWFGSGTNGAQGVVWGWRVLSPGEPFTQGKPAGQTKKIMVLMTDGMNGIVDQATDTTWSDFSAYGYLQHGRIAPKTYQAYREHLDARMLQACTNAKADDITIYTITFGNIDAATEALYEQCASEPPYHYSAATVGELEEAFGTIGEHITKIRLVH